MEQVPRRHAIAFYLGIPLVLAFLNGANHAGMARHMPVDLGMIYWAGILLPSWLALDLTTRLLAVALRPWSPPLWIVLLFGAILEIIIMHPVARWYGLLFTSYIPQDVQYSLPPPLLNVGREWDVMLSYAVTPAFWIIVNYYYDRLLDIPRYRGSILEIMGKPRPHEPVALDEQSVSEDATVKSAEAPLDGASVSPFISTFLRYLPRNIGTEVIALKAEDHYIRVYTTSGNALIRYKFSDALNEVRRLSGLQVHRSYWVRKSAIKGIQDDKNDLTIVLNTGLLVPVSRAYQKVVKLSDVPQLS
ncbi:MAG: LytTR family DNA-binding domain-containing protein [Rhodospirillaceae bacterium]|nr:LytTR family DNA-binding domain-containing protein [Rhodospirillaceae bacterium]